MHFLDFGQDFRAETNDARKSTTLEKMYVKLNVHYLIDWVSLSLSTLSSRERESRERVQSKESRCYFFFDFSEALPSVRAKVQAPVM